MEQFFHARRDAHGGAAPRVLALLAVVAILVGTLPATSGAQLFDEARVRALAVVGSTPLAAGRTVRAAVEIQVGRGFHVNANPASEDFLIPTAVSVTGVEGVEVVEVLYPAPLEKTFGFWPGELKVWEGDVVAGLTLRVAEAAPLGDINLDFVIDYQACNDEVCFAPAKTEVRVPVRIVPAGTAVREVESPLLERAPFPDGP